MEQRDPRSLASPRDFHLCLVGFELSPVFETIGCSWDSFCGLVMHTCFIEMMYVKSSRTSVFIYRKLSPTCGCKDNFFRLYSLLLEYSLDFGVTYLQILEGLLKHPENRECADCKTKYGFLPDLNYQHYYAGSFIYSICLAEVQDGLVLI